MIRPTAFWEERQVALMLGQPVSSVDSEDKFVTVDDTEIAYGKLVWCTGSSPRMLIGIVPKTAPLIAAGALGENDVDMDEFCRTSLPAIYVMGDCASHANRLADGTRMRLGSVQNANDQAKVAVSHIMGEAESYNAVPWFWSNQYELMLQAVELSTGFDQTILRGDPAHRSFSIVYLKDGRFITIDCVNAVKYYAQGRTHILARSKFNIELPANASAPLKELS